MIVESLHTTIRPQPLPAQRHAAADSAFTATVVNEIDDRVMLDGHRCKATVATALVSVIGAHGVLFGIMLPSLVFRSRRLAQGGVRAAAETMLTIKWSARRPRCGRGFL